LVCRHDYVTTWGSRQVADDRRLDVHPGFHHLLSKALSRCRHARVHDSSAQRLRLTRSGLSRRILQPWRCSAAVGCSRLLGGASGATLTP
jgi:hypothetical protein